MQLEEEEKLQREIEAKLSGIDDVLNKALKGIDCVGTIDSTK